MGIQFRLALFFGLAGLAASGQTLSNKSLNGKYYFREVLVTSSTNQAQSIYGTLTFDGNGNFSYAGQQISGSGPTTSSNGSGLTYSIQSSGIGTIADPLRSGTSLNI